MHTSVTMRTNIDLDDALLAEVMREGAFATKKDAVHAALRAFLRLSQRDMFGKVESVGDLDAMRID